MELMLRFVLGGAIVSLFALVADVVRPRGFAGLFGAAPSVALATLGITIVWQGRPYAAMEARSMVAGAAALFLYAVACVYFIGVRRARVVPAVFALLAVWLVSAAALWSLCLR